MKKLLTLALCVGVIGMAIWSYNTNIHNTKATSYETRSIIYLSPIEKKMREVFPVKVEEKKEVEVSNISNIIVTEHQQSQELVKELPLYDIPLNIDLQKYIYELCEKKEVPHDLVLAVIKTESNFNPKAKNVNKNGSVDKGIMQINSCHTDLCKSLGVNDLFDPYQNIRVGVELLSNIYKKYPDVHKSLMVYNMGEFGAKRNWKVGRGTTTYSRRVISNINIIKSSV